MLTAINPKAGQATVFGIGDQNGFYYKSGKGKTWDELWGALGGVFIFPPVTVSWGEGRIDAFGIGIDGAMYERHYENGQWSSSWQSLGGVFTSAPAAVSWCSAPGCFRVGY
tara:strand:- start:8733 stop:9065 length:333 start_codon:yes stop_codon:yes gene_type:complete